MPGVMPVGGNELKQRVLSCRLIVLISVNRGNVFWRRASKRAPNSFYYDYIFQDINSVDFLFLRYEVKAEEIQYTGLCESHLLMRARK